LENKYKKGKNMPEEILKTRVGRTPLIRARELEKELKIKKIYLKLEGNNPSGHREDRLAYLIIRDAIARGKKTITMGTFGTIGGSLSYISQYFDVKCVFYVPNKKIISRKKLFTHKNVKIIEYGKTYQDCVKESKRVAKEKKWYDANFGEANSLMNMYAFSYITKEINHQINDKIDTVFCQTFNGSSISGLHLGFKELWVNEEIDYLPQLWVASTDNGNAIIESYKKNSRKILVLTKENLHKTKLSRHMINPDCLNGQDALNAIHDTNGVAIGVADSELEKYSKKLKQSENIKITIPNSYPIAAFIKKVKQGKIKNGNHVIILDDGTIELDVRELEKKDLNISYKKFLENLDSWLLDFSDPLEEMKEAVENAFEKGFVIGAFDRKTIVGVAILSKMQFDFFFPTYHLSYIATKKDVKGRGIATQLLKKAIEVSKGELTLHVEINNKRAIKLYEKMGLRKKYYRMQYAGEEHEKRISK
jgi:threonine synthase